MAENYRLSFTPVLVIDLYPAVGTVLRCGGHLQEIRESHTELDAVVVADFLSKPGRIFSRKSDAFTPLARR